MGKSTAGDTGRVEATLPIGRSLSVSEELTRLIEALQAEFPAAVNISFDFQDILNLHIDFRTLEEAHFAQTRLPALCGGIFSDIFSGSSPRHPFFHRVSAKVEK